MVQQGTRTPRKAELRAEVVRRRVVLAAARTDTHVRENVRSTAKLHGGQFAVLFRNRTKVFPAQTGSDRQVGLHLIVVLEEKADDIVSEILAEGGRHTGLGIGLRVLLNRSIVEKVPDIVERVAGTISPKRSVHGKQTG